MMRRTLILSTLYMASLGFMIAAYSATIPA